MLYVVPIEPLEERYSKQWLEWTTSYLLEQDEPYAIINCASYNRIGKGAFLDVIGTNSFKNDQMKHILGLFHNDMIKDGDIFWFHDLWYPGLEMLAYIRDALGINFKIYGMLHAGTYDPHDFLTKKKMHKWGHELEQSWFRIVDGIFLATEFHSKMIRLCRNLQVDKLHVTGFPMYSEGFAYHQRRYEDRENIIVFPHRMDEEKNPDKFADLADRMKDSKFHFVFTKKTCQTKEQYYDLLKRAKYAVSFADQETWGIAMQEAVLCGCIPIVPDRLSYQEMYPRMFKYSTSTQAVYAVRDCIQYCEDRPKITKSHLTELQDLFVYNGKYAFDRMFRIMGI